MTAQPSPRLATRVAGDLDTAAEARPAGSSAETAAAAAPPPSVSKPPRTPSKPGEAASPADLDVDRDRAMPPRRPRRDKPADDARTVVNPSRTPATPPPDHPIWDAVYGVLTIAADIITHDYSEDDDHIDALPGLIDVGAACECHTWDLPGSEAAWWIAREARYRIAAALGSRPHGRDDPLTRAVVDALARHPADAQARVLNAAADALAADTRDPPDTHL